MPHANRRTPCVHVCRFARPPPRMPDSGAQRGISVRLLGTTAVRSIGSSLCLDWETPQEKKRLSLEKDRATLRRAAAVTTRPRRCPRPPAGDCFDTLRPAEHRRPAAEDRWPSPASSWARRASRPSCSRRWPAGSRTSRTSSRGRRHSIPVPPPSGAWSSRPARSTSRRSSSPRTTGPAPSRPPPTPMQQPPAKPPRVTTSSSRPACSEASSAWSEPLSCTRPARSCRPIYLA